MVQAGAVLLVWLLDRCFGEPRSAWHPVAWFGSLAARPGARIRDWPAPAALAGGTALWFLLVGMVVVLAGMIEDQLLGAPAWLALPALGLVLKPALAWRMLEEEVEAVDVALAQGLDAARRRVAGICSRDVSKLDATGVRETAISSLAENLNDSLVAPLFWFVVAGLPGAWAWRAVNTLDAMWGYRGHWEWAGKWAARADDVLGFVPARITGLLLWRCDFPFGLLRQEAARTPSPNAGWPIGAMALRLRIRIMKHGSYVLNASAPHPDGNACARALALGRGVAMSSFAAASMLVLLLHGGLRS